MSWLERIKKQSDAQRLQRLVQETFGYEKLRPGQESAIKAILDHQDILAILPTGLGKSLIYQVAALFFAGPIIIVSPLIALQRDQVETLGKLHIGRAALLNSSMSKCERAETLHAIGMGKITYLFLAPEQFANQDLFASLKRMPPSVFVVDEAHCISEWGHDFRPDYLRLGDVIEKLGHPITVALTATASPLVRTEIIERLGMRTPQIVVKGFDRPNIWLSVECFTKKTEKKKALVTHVLAARKPGIVYTSTRKHAEEVAHELQKVGVSTAFYHAGMRTTEREQVQEQFMADEIEVIVATIAFGMGIDKPNIRFVFHYDISGSVDSYYQEIGRAGRDGQKAEALLFYRSEDMRIHQYFANGDEEEESTSVNRKEFNLSRIEMMRGYAEVSDCRREYLLNYFGEESSEPCGYCDNCAAGITIPNEEELLFPVNTQVNHTIWGPGIILRYEGDKMVVLFKSVGYKTLAIRIIKERSLLTRIS